MKMKRLMNKMNTQILPAAIKQCGAYKILFSLLIYLFQKTDISATGILNFGVL